MRDVAKDLGLPYTTYVNYEKGDREPSSEVLIAIADYYNTTVDYLIGKTSSPMAYYPDSNTAPAPPIDTQIAKEYGEKTLDDLHLYLRLDAEDRGEVRGTMKQLLKSEKYTAEGPNK
jgi:transcriptional regulator with XRE-family HTH domain